MVGFANAKINIGLYVTERRPDGYHNIWSVFYPVYKLRDVVEIIESKYFDLIVTGLELDVDIEKNLVYKAYSLLKKDFKLPNVTIFLHKIIPFGAGLGGGSSDAAQTLILLNKMFNLNLSEQQLIDYASKIGADVAFFIKNKPVIASGIGNIFKPIDLDLTKYNIVIIKPDFSISTKEAYSLISPKKPNYPLDKAITEPVEKWKELIFNDFEEPLFKKYPELGKIKNFLYNNEALYVSMTGSGSAIFAITKRKLNLKNLKYPFVWQSEDIKSFW